MLDVAFRVSWNYKGQKGDETLFHTAIGNFTSAQRDWTPAFRQITAELNAAVKEQFDTQGQGNWAQLAPSTIKAKGNDRILFETGAMYASFQSGGSNHVEEISRDRLMWGSTDPKALFHQTGTGSGFQMRVKGPGRGMPMRKIMELTEGRKRAIRSVLVRHLATIARREGYAVGGDMDLDPLSARQLGSSILGL